MYWDVAPLSYSYQPWLDHEIPLFGQLHTMNIAGPVLYVKYGSRSLIVP